jgi:hypothetical protein
MAADARGERAELAYPEQVEVEMIRAVSWLCLALSCGVALGCAHRENPVTVIAKAQASVPPAPVLAEAPPPVVEQSVAPERPVIALPRPPFRRVVGKAFADDPEARLPTLRIVRQTKNQITDLDAWYERNDLKSRSVPVDAALSSILSEHGVPLEISGAKATRVLQHEDHEIIFYDSAEQRGRYLVVRRGEQISGPFDFAAYREPPKSKDSFTAMDTLWAEAREDTLFVSHAHATYAASSHGDNAYVTALSLPEGALRWRSKALVSNSRECLLLELALVCGYGFTDESDNVFVLRASDGEIVQRLKVDSGPEQFVLKDGSIHLRTYDTDYVLGIR